VKNISVVPNAEYRRTEFVQDGRALCARTLGYGSKPPVTGCELVLQIDRNQGVARVLHCGQPLCQFGTNDKAYLRLFLQKHARGNWRTEYVGELSK